jgi:hypothetical protein
VGLDTGRLEHGRHGVWNCGSHHIDPTGATLLAAPEGEAMTTMGWIDAWRSKYPEGREFTWFSRRWGNEVPARSRIRDVADGGPGLRCSLRPHHATGPIRRRGER